MQPRLHACISGPRRSSRSQNAPLVHDTITVFLGRSSTGRRDSWLCPVLASLSVCPMKKRGANRRSTMQILFLYAYKVFEGTPRRLAGFQIQCDNLWFCYFWGPLSCIH